MKKRAMLEGVQKMCYMFASSLSAHVVSVAVRGTHSLAGSEGSVCVCVSKRASRQVHGGGGV